MRLLLSFVLLSTPFAQASAEILTAGPGGTYATIQAAINATLDAPGNDEIRIAAGLFTENLDFTPNGSGRILQLTGGWVDSFTTQSETPSVIDGGAAGSVINVGLDNGDSLTLDNLRIQNGLAGLAAGLLITQYGDSVMEISRCEIVDNVAQDDRAESAGMRVSVNGTSQFTLVDSLVSNNQTICSGTVDCQVGGIGLQAADSSVVNISRNGISNNSVVITEGSALSGGARLSASGSSTLVFDDNRVTGNIVAGTSSAANGVGVGLTGDGTITARRNWIENNNSNVPVPNSLPQLAFAQFGSNTAILSDTVIVKGNGQGLRLRASGDGTPVVHAVNLTIAEHAFVGVQAQNSAAGGTVTISNTIALNNDSNTSFSGDVDTVTNLFSGDALFSNAPASDFSLAPGSPAIDSGTNAPPGGLGPLDVERNARIAGGTVDIGAYEAASDSFFEDGFESP